MEGKEKAKKLKSQKTVNWGYPRNGTYFLIPHPSASALLHLPTHFIPASE